MHDYGQCVAQRFQPEAQCIDGLLATQFGAIHAHQEIVAVDPVGGTHTKHAAGGFLPPLTGGCRKPPFPIPSLRERERSGTAYRDNIRYNFNSETGTPMKLKITAIGNSAGVILPKELLARLRVDKGDELYVLETPDGIRLTNYDPEFAAKMEVAEQVMRKRRTLLNKLAQ